MNQNQQAVRRSSCRQGLSALTLAAAASWIALGCGSENNKTYKLTVSDENPVGTPVAQVIDTWAEHVAEQSGGRIELNVVHGGELLTSGEAYQGVQSGVADIGQYILNHTSQDFSLNAVMLLPFMGWPGQLETLDIYLDLLDEVPEMQDEWKTTIIGTWMMPGEHLHNTVKELKVPADINGLKIYVPQAFTTETVRTAGAIPVEIPVFEMASALDNGTIEGAMFSITALEVFGALEKLPYHTFFGGGINMTPTFLIMNTDVFGNLPDDLQRVVMDSGKVFEDGFKAADLGFEAGCMAQIEGWNHSVIHLTTEEIAVWYDLVKPQAHQTWIASCEADGLPAQAVYDDVLERIEAAAD